MSTRPYTYCNECGTERKEANHWWSSIGFTEPQFFTFDEANKLYPLEHVKRQDYCGREDVTLAHQRWMDTGDIRKQEVSQ